MKIITWNVNGLRAIVKKMPSTLGAFFKDLGADIICLQETKINEKMLTDDLTQVPGYEAFFATCKVKQGYSGVCTYAREGITLDAKEGLGVAKELDEEGRVMVTDHGGFVLLNIYFPNGGRGGDRLTFKNDFQDEVSKYCAELRKQGRHVIVLGDYNIAHTKIDIYNPEDPDNELHSGFRPEERQWLTDFLDSGFVDCFRERHPGETGHYTWWSPRSGARADNRGWRLDYILVDRPFYDSDVVDVAIMRLVGGSDHCPVSITLRQQATLPPHSPPLLSSKRRSRQAKLGSFFARNDSAKRPRLDSGADAAAAKGNKNADDGEEDSNPVEEHDEDEGAMRVGGLRQHEAATRLTTYTTQPLRATAQADAGPPGSAPGLTRSVTEEAVAGATNIISRAIDNTDVPQPSSPPHSLSSSSSSSSSSSPPLSSSSPPSSASTSTPPTSSPSATSTEATTSTTTQRANKPTTKSTKKQKTSTTASKKNGGKQLQQQTSMLSFLGKRKEPSPDSSGGVP